MFLVNYSEDEWHDDSISAATMLNTVLSIANKNYINVYHLHHAYTVAHQENKTHYRIKIQNFYNLKNLYRPSKPTRVLT